MPHVNVSNVTIVQLLFAILSDWNFACANDCAGSTESVEDCRPFAFPIHIDDMLVWQWIRIPKMKMVDCVLLCCVIQMNAISMEKTKPKSGRARSVLRSGRTIDPDQVRFAGAVNNNQIKQLLHRNVFSSCYLSHRWLRFGVCAYLPGTWRITQSHRKMNKKKSKNVDCLEYFFPQNTHIAHQSCTQKQKNIIKRSANTTNTYIDRLFINYTVEWLSKYSLWHCTAA